MTPSWSVVEYPGPEGLRRLEVDWKRLLLEMPDRGPQHAYETIVAYFLHLSRAGDRYTCLALSDGERVRAIVPLEQETVSILGRATRVWGLPWHLYDLRRDVICPPGEPRRELLPCLVRFFRRAPDPPAWLVFESVLEGSALWECLRSCDPRTYCTDVVDAAYVFDCERPFADLAGRRSKHFRANLRTAHNRLAALTDVRFESATDSPSLGPALATFLELEASGWKGDAGARGAIRLKPDQLAFYRELAVSLRDLGRCAVNSLYADGHCIASQLCLRAGSEYAMPKFAYDERYARVSPGHLLFEWTLERACRDPEIKRLNIVSSAEWFREWRPDLVPVYGVYLGIGRSWGRVLVGLLRLRFAYGPRIKGWLRRVPFRRTQNR